MTPDAALNPIENPKIQPPYTAGMTTRVVKGSIWTLGGSILPLAVSFVATPFIIRFLGTESYGVLLLVGLIPTYFSFADFGMGVASTKFASEAFGEGDRAKESDIVWTATTVAGISATIVAVPIFLFALPIVTALNVPGHLLAEANIALKLTSAGFVIGTVASVLNSPMLARLRMDLNTVTTAVPKVLLAAVTPFILYYGGGLVWAVAWALVVAIVTLVFIFAVSARLLPALARPAFRREQLRPLLRFGGGLAAAALATLLLVNLEKLLLSRLVSVAALAFYSVAFTFASMATMLSSSLIQSLIPAFSQLSSPEMRPHFEVLFARTIRLNAIVLFPSLAFLFVVAKPFFTIWAGPEFGRESTVPFYILLFGLLFNLLAFVPYCSLVSVGKSQMLAKLYWAQLVAYFGLVLFLINWLGITGAALAWSLRVIVDAFILYYLARKILKVSFGSQNQIRNILLALLILLPMPASVGLFGESLLVVLMVALLCFPAYVCFVWRSLLELDEKAWISSRFRALARS